MDGCWGASYCVDSRGHGTAFAVLTGFGNALLVDSVGNAVVPMARVVTGAFRGTLADKAPEVVRELALAAAEVCALVRV